MTVRIASLVCLLGLIAVAQAADAQTTAKQPDGAVASPEPVPAAPTAVEPEAATEREESGRSKWWPAPASKTPRPAPAPTTERDKLGRSKWWPAPPDNTSQSASLQRNGKDGTSEPLLPFEQGVLFLPYLGLSIPIGDNSGSYTVGHNFGALIGVHLVREFSLNMEINVDYMSPGPMATETQIDYALSPLLQARSARHLWVLGLKLGMYNLTRSVAGEDRYARPETTNYSTTGFVWGVTLGGFVPVGPMALGGLARITYRNHSSNCKENTSNTSDSLCNDGDEYGVNPAFVTFDFSVAALF